MNPAKPSTSKRISSHAGMATPPPTGLKGPSNSAQRPRRHPKTSTGSDVLLPLQRDLNVERKVSFRQTYQKILAEILGGFPLA
jgi:hypothetical protein